MSGKFSKRERAVEIVNKLFVHTDNSNWQKLKEEVFAESVHFDMSSLSGEPAESVKGDGENT